MKIADEVAWAAWRNDPRTKVAQTVLIAAREEAQAQEQYAVDHGVSRLRLFLDEIDREYRIELARERAIDPTLGSLRRGELREIAAAMFGGKVHRRPYVGWVLDIDPVE